jgi:isocitrate dehydrogenase (NAD+)
MLDALDHGHAALDIEKAVAAVLREGKHRTADIGGKCSTSTMGDAIVAKLRKD